ncbi:MAG: NAD(P)H-dependent oxidoreductase, partial [Deltaproteobacteria bacterium]|nr:NAD(P)H-dependent oxidoreductase [Deltaproteobacteria bacterium]
MKILGIFGSPRRGGNTDILLEETLKGAQKEGAEV